ncbi:hypothetical protein ACO0SA_003943 [Hanseniaspora valbyensis]
MSQYDFIYDDASTIKIPFYTELKSMFNKRFYAFSSKESLKLFIKSQNRMDKPSSIQRLDNSQYIGIPLFECRMKKDASYIFTKKRNNLIIYKYIVLPSDENDTQRKHLMSEYLENKEYEFVCNNEEHNISIYKVVYSEVDNKSGMLSMETARTYTLKFRNDPVVMSFLTYDDYVKVKSSLFPNSKWIYNDNLGDVKVDDFFMEDNFKLMLEDKSIACEFDNKHRSNKWVTHTLDEYMGLLKIADNTNPPAFPLNEKVQYHDNSLLSEFSEKAICMTFILIVRQKYRSRAMIVNGQNNGYSMTPTIINGTVVLVPHVF